MEYAAVFALSLAITEAVELPLGALMGARKKWELALIFLMNIATNPAVVLLYTLARQYTAINPWLIKLPLELLAIGAEALILGKYSDSLKRPLLFSAVLNAVSFTVGEVINTIL